MRYFMFARGQRAVEGDEDGTPHQTACWVEVNSTDSWEQFRPNWMGTGFGGLLLRTPDIAKTPATTLTALDNRI